MQSERVVLGACGLWSDSVDWRCTRGGSVVLGGKGGMLTKRSIETLIMTGVTTEGCVSSTLRAAIDLGYRCITVRDACASSNPALHKAELAMIGVEGGIFGEIATTAEIVARFTR